MLPLEIEQRAAFIGEGKTWLGTPFRDQADVKGGGVDCAMFLVCCATAIGILPQDLADRLQTVGWRKSGIESDAACSVTSYILGEAPDEGERDFRQYAKVITSADGRVIGFDPRPYPPQFHLHQNAERFLGIVGLLGAEIPNPTGLPAGALAIPGDVIVYRVGRCFSHGGIVIENGHVLHAYYSTKNVTISPLGETELALLPDGKPRPFKLFDLWSKRDGI